MGDCSRSIGFSINGNFSSLKYFYMKIGSIKENIKTEKRVAITPEIAKKFIDNGFEINLEKNYANHLGFEDKDYEALNVNILDNEKLVLEKSEK